MDVPKVPVLVRKTPLSGFAWLVELDVPVAPLVKTGCGNVGRADVRLRGSVGEAEERRERGGGERGAQRGGVRVRGARVVAFCERRRRRREGVGEERRAELGGATDGGEGGVLHENSDARDVRDARGERAEAGADF